MSESGQESPKEDGQEKPPVKRKFLNGWTSELENLMADWADKAACYRWMHEKTSINYQERDRAFNIPVIILSALTAGANFSLNSVVGNDKEMQKLAQIGLGGASLITGIIQTFMNFYGYAKGSEAHRVAGISWGKFNRLLCIEMNLHPDERMDSLNFLKMFRIELDRLIEQSPPMPEAIIKQFNTMFKSNTDIVKPEITGILMHTKVYKDQGSRLKRLAAEATVALHYRKGVIKQMVADDLEGRTKKIAMEVAKETVKEIVDQQKAIQLAAISNVAKQKPATTMVEKDKEERTKELQTLVKTKAGAVAELRSKFKVTGGGGIEMSRPPSIRDLSVRTTPQIQPTATPASQPITIDSGIVVQSQQGAQQQQDQETIQIN
jgi:hypothetical protein